MPKLSNETSIPQSVDQTMPADHLLDSDVILVFRRMLARYRGLHKSGEEIPQHREIDMIYLGELLNRQDLNHVQLYDEIDCYLDKMITGIIIDGKEVIGTGQSRLKTILRQTLVHDCFNRDAMQKRDERHEELKKKLEAEATSLSSEDLQLVKRLQEEIELKDSVIEQQAKRITLLEEKNAILTEALDGAEQEIKTLKVDLKKAENKISDLNTENAKLRLKIKSLENDNKALEKQNQDLRKKYTHFKQNTASSTAGKRSSLFQKNQPSVSDEISNWFPFSLWK